MRRDHGAQAAAALARWNVVAPHRDGGQAQFAPHPVSSPKQWLLRARLQRARELLESTDLPVERVAAQAGFPTPAPCERGSRPSCARRQARTGGRFAARPCRSPSGDKRAPTDRPVSGLVPVSPSAILAVVNRAGAPSEAGLPKSRRQEQVEETQRALVGTARTLFAQRGYADVSIDAITAGAGVTKGALYHHFADKQDLFRTVFGEVEREVVHRVGAQIEGRADPWERLWLGCQAFLDACLDTSIQRIVFVDAPVVLGWAQWRAADAGSSIGLISDVIEQAIAAGQIEETRAVSLAHLILGALNEAGMMIASSRNKRRARNDIEVDLRRVLDGLRTRPTPRHRDE